MWPDPAYSGSGHLGVGHGRPSMDGSDGTHDGSGDSGSDRGGDEAGAEDADLDSVQDAAAERQRERADHVEDALAAVREDLGEEKYPVSSEELAATYADQAIDLPNETETLGSVFDRIDEQFEDERAVYEAVVRELEAEERFPVDAEAADEPPPTWSEERAETQHEFREAPFDDDDYESSVERSRERAREAQAESDEDDRA